MEKPEDFSFELDPSFMGAAVREHLVKLQNVFGYYNEEHDKALLVYEKSKLVLEEVTEKVSQAVADQPNLPGTKVRAKLFVEVTLSDGQVLTLSEAKKNLLEAKDAYSKAKSKLSELKSAIDVARSALVWDRHELGSVS